MNERFYRFKVKSHINNTSCTFFSNSIGESVKLLGEWFDEVAKMTGARKEEVVRSALMK